MAASEKKRGDKYSRKAPGPRGTDRPYHQNIHTIFLDTHITSCQGFADARGDILGLLLRPKAFSPPRFSSCTATLYSRERPSSNTLEQRNYRVSAAPATLLSLVLAAPGTRFSRPKHQISHCSGVHSKRDSRLFDLFYLLETLSGVFANK